jgi:hypothetical protein
MKIEWHNIREDGASVRYDNKAIHVYRVVCWQEARLKDPLPITLEDEW